MVTPKLQRARNAVVWLAHELDAINAALKSARKEEKPDLRIILKGVYKEYRAQERLVARLEKQLA